MSAAKMKNTELTDPKKLESTVDTMLMNFSHSADTAMTVIGRTQDEVITLMIYSRDGFEFRFNQRITDIDGKNICLPVIKPPPALPFNK